MISNKRAIVGLNFVENGTTEVRIPKGFLERGLVLSGVGLDTISGAGSAVRARGAPIKSISIIGDNGKVLQVVRPHDVLVEAELYEQTALSSMVSPPASAAIGAQAFNFQLHLLFQEPFSGDQGARTALPTWTYDNLILRVEWGGHAELVVGGAGVVTISRLSLTADGIQEDFSSLGDPFVWGKRLSKAVKGFKEVATGGAANSKFPIELPRTADFRSIVLVALDANGVPTNGLINAITLRVNNTVSQFAEVDGASLRSDNAKVFGVNMPPGVYVLEFAEDQDISRILEATKFTALDLQIDINAVANSQVRVYEKMIEPGTAA